MDYPITRNLGDGADFEPDWRNRVVTEYLKKVATSERKLSCSELLVSERDPVVRQVVRYHLEDGCVCPQAVRYALATQQNNGATGIASTIRAMILADCTCDQIARHFKTDRRNIVVFTRLFFDVERYLGQEFWLESLVRRTKGNSPVELREKRLLRTAFHRGWAGLRHELSPRSSKTADDVKVLNQEVQHAVTSRALEYVQNLNDEGLAPSQEDFQRYNLISMANSRGAAADAQSDFADNKWLNWFMEAAERGALPDVIVDGWNAKCDEVEGEGGRPGRRALGPSASSVPRLKTMDPEKRPRLARDCYRDPVTGNIVPIEFKDVKEPEAGLGQSEAGQQS